MLLYFFLAALCSMVSAIDILCPSGWYIHQSNCIKLFEDKVFYHDATVNCANSVPGPVYLASVHSADDNSVLRRLTSESDHVWIGLNDIEDEGSFQWTDGSPVDYTNWAPGQPDNLADSDCVYLLPDGTWDDAQCEWSASGNTPAKAYVCETPVIL